ncbi:MAG: diaminopimelate epimerase [Lachnospiraceae bacterium]|nr:diaminopimelate epimerase [Lachnospiraceae bacterium]
MKFTKMHGCGNDYIYFNCFEETVEHPEELAVRLSDRRKGIGGDGIVLIRPSQKADFFMDMYNNDGSRGKMCGNAIRCVGKYVYEHGMTDKLEPDIETLSGIKHLKLITQNNPLAALFSDENGDPADGGFSGSAFRPEAGSKERIAGATVDMGAPVTDPALIPLNTDIIRENTPGYTLGAMARCHRFTFVSMGNPHAVTFVDDVETAPVEELGPVYEHHEIFPERANIEFVHVIDRSHIDMRVWERGSGETFACGTGACASAYACIWNGLTDDLVTVNMRGGKLNIRYDRQQNTIFMTGPATEVFTGTI